MKGGGSIYYDPSYLMISFWAEGPNLSGLKTLVNSNFKNGIRESHFPGNLASKGESAL